MLTTIIIFFSRERRKNFSCADQNVNSIIRNRANDGRKELLIILSYPYYSEEKKNIMIRSTPGLSFCKHYDHRVKKDSTLQFVNYLQSTIYNSLL